MHGRERSVHRRRRGDPSVRLQRRAGSTLGLRRRFFTMTAPRDRFRGRVLALGAAFVLASLVLMAQALPQGVKKGATMAGITEYTYPNGLRLLLLPDSGSNTITVNVTSLVGSRHEGAGESGMAHLLEHLNFIKSTHDRNITKELRD